MERIDIPTEKLNNMIIENNEKIEKLLIENAFQDILEMLRRNRAPNIPDIKRCAKKIVFEIEEFYDIK